MDNISRTRFILEQIQSYNSILFPNIKDNQLIKYEIILMTTLISGSKLPTPFFVSKLIKK